MIKISRQSQGSYVERLPLEVLTAILSILIREHGDLDEPTVLNVCRTWREAALRAPECWDKISVKISPKTFVRSSSFPLGGRGTYRERDVGDILSLIRGRMNRAKARRLDLSICCEDRSFRWNEIEHLLGGVGSILRSQTPRLRRYSEQGAGGILLGILPDLPMSTYQGLTHMRLTSSIPVMRKQEKTFDFPLLKRLYLSDLEPSSVLPLLNCPYLETLIISKSLPSSAAFEDLMELLRKFPTLRKIVLDMIFVPTQTAAVIETLPQYANTSVRALTVGGNLLPQKGEGCLTLDRTNSTFVNLDELTFGYHTKLDFGAIDDINITKLRILSIPFDIDISLSDQARKRTREFMQSLKELRSLHLGADHPGDMTDSQYHWANHRPDQKALGQQAMTDFVMLLTEEDALCPKLETVNVSNLRLSDRMKRLLETLRSCRQVTIVSTSAFSSE